MQTAQEVTAANLASEEALYKVAAQHVVFKAGKTTAVMVELVRQLVPDRLLWGDEFEFNVDRVHDANVIGTAFRLLLRARVIDRVSEYRPSTRKEQNGRLVWRYRIANLTLARAFLKRNAQQQEMELA